MSPVSNTLRLLLHRNRIIPTVAPSLPASRLSTSIQFPNLRGLNPYRAFTAPPHRSHKAYRSAIDLRTLLLAATVSAGIAYLGYTTQAKNDAPDQQQLEDRVAVPLNEWERRYTVIDVMGPQPLPGRPGNLTAEQEAKLKDMWAQTLEFFGMSHEEVTRAQQNGSPASPTTDSPEKKKRGLMSRLRGKSKGESDGEATADSVNDKHGQVKEYEQALASMNPDQIQEAFWNMSKHDHPDAILLRFLRARKWDLHAAQVMALSTLHWRLKDAHVDDDIVAKGEEHAMKQAQSSDAAEKKAGEDFLAQFRLGKSMLHGTDKEGRPCCYVRVRLHRAGEQSVESLERFTIYTIETARMLLKAPIDTATIIFDMTDFSMANMDYTPVKFMIKVFEANYPESLGKVVVYRAPWVFSRIWSIIKGLLDPVVASKISFASSVLEMEEYLPKSQIIKELGGELDWTYQYVEPREGENKQMEDTAARDQLVADRRLLTKDYEKETLAWIHGEDRGAARDELAQRLAENYWRLDPYIRARSLYDRTGVIGPMGKLNFYPESAKEAPPVVEAAAGNE